MCTAMVSGQTAQGEVGKRDRETWGDVRREGGPSPWSPVEAETPFTGKGLWETPCTNLVVSCFTLSDYNSV